MERLQMDAFKPLHTTNGIFGGGEGTVVRMEPQGLAGAYAFKIYHAETANDKELRHRRISSILELDKKISTLPPLLQNYLRAYSAIPLALVEFPKGNPIGFAMADVFARKCKYGPYLAKELMDTPEQLRLRKIPVMQPGSLRTILITSCVTVAILNAIDVYLPDISGPNAFILGLDHASICFLVDIDSYFSPGLHDPTQIAETDHWQNTHRPIDSYSAVDDVWKIGLLARRLAAQSFNATTVIHKNSKTNLYRHLTRDEDVSVVWEMCNNVPVKRPSFLEVIEVLRRPEETDVEKVAQVIAALSNPQTRDPAPLRKIVEKPPSNSSNETALRFLENILNQTDAQARAKVQKEQFKRSIEQLLKQLSRSVTVAVIENPTSSTGQILRSLKTRNSLGKKYWEFSSLIEFINQEMNDMVDVTYVGTYPHLMLRTTNK